MLSALRCARRSVRLPVWGIATQLQAAIAGCHAGADDFASTDWAQIAALYDRLWAYQPSAVVAANRAGAVAMSDGPAAGLALLDDVCDAGGIGRYRGGPPS